MLLFLKFSKMDMDVIFIVLLTAIVCVQCYSIATFRLSTERGPVEGLVEVFYDTKWNNICESSESYDVAYVVCRQLGYIDPKEIVKPQMLRHPYNYNQRLLPYGIDCRRTDSRQLQDCSVHGLISCFGRSTIGVDCRYMDVRITQEGFVEFFHDNHWKGVCPPDFNIQAGNVICRQLGYSDGSVIVDISDHDGKNSNPMFEYDFQCTGQETGISQCLKLKKTSNCPVTTAKRMKCLNGSLEDLVSMSCSINSFNIDVDYQALRQLYPQFNESDLLLGGACTGNLTGDRLIFTEGFDHCFTRNTQVDEHMFAFTNKLVYVVNSSANIVNEFHWNLDIECRVFREASTETSFTPIESNHQHHLSNSTQLIRNISINLYTDPLYQHKINASLTVGQPIYVKVESEKVPSLRMILKDCYSKPNQNSTKNQSHILIDNGCENDDNTHLIRYTDSETRFFFTAFAFPGGEAIVDLHCDVRFCSSLKRSTACHHGCHFNSAVIG